MGFKVTTANGLYERYAGYEQPPVLGNGDPLEGLRALLSGGGGIDPKAVRAFLEKLDPQLVQALLRGLFPAMHPGAKSFCDKVDATKQCGTPTPPSCNDMKPCFPSDLQKYYPDACNDRPTCEDVPEKPGTTGKTFDVWFEHQDGQKTKQRSPIVLDLNGNGRPDLTGDVKLENGRYVAKGGGKVDFDIDPTKRSWKTKSVARRPGHGAPAVPGGYAKIFDKDGNPIADHVPLKDALKRGKKGIQEGRAEVYDAKGELVGEYKQDEKSGKMMYFFGGRKDAEKTEWMAANGGDALLAWDVNNDGKIDSSKELFGEFDVDGTKKFANGYEKLAQYFDANQDGKVDQQELAGAEAKGVRIWRDTNGDAKTDAGELTGLAENGIHELATTFDAADLSSTFTKKSA